MLPAAGLASIALLAVLAPVTLPRVPDAIDLANVRAAPGWAHWFGTDELGRDLFTRVVYGARVSLFVGGLSAVVSAVVGTTIGAVAGYARGWVDGALMRLTDAMLAVPRLPLLMIGAAIMEPTVLGLTLLVGLAGWMETARVVRAEALSISARPFMDAARALGTGPTRLVWRHLIPNVLPTVAVATTLAVGRGILLESAMSFFGVGVRPPLASWGSMLYQAQTTMSSEPWVAVFPGMFVFGTVLAINVIGGRLIPERH
ncbi:MAG TPA: ABC transporter permease [Gemmatimonadales bacterium]